jgi:hypothetical protein
MVTVSVGVQQHQRHGFAQNRASADYYGVLASQSNRGGATDA